MTHNSWRHDCSLGVSISDIPNRDGRSNPVSRGKGCMMLCPEGGKRVPLQLSWLSVLSSLPPNGPHPYRLLKHKGLTPFVDVMLPQLVVLWWTCLFGPGELNFARVGPRGGKTESVGIGFAQGLGDKCKQDLFRWSNPILQRKLCQRSGQKNCLGGKSVPLVRMYLVSWEPECGALGSEGNFQQSQAFPMGPSWAGVLIFSQLPKDPVTKNKVQAKWNFLLFHFLIVLLPYHFISSLVK